MITDFTSFQVCTKLILLYHKLLKKCNTFNPIICKSKKKTNLLCVLTTFFKTARFENEKEMRRKALKHTQKKIWNPALLGIRNPLSWNPESSTRNPESTAWNPESKTLLDSLTWGEAYRKIHSTETALLKVQNDLLLAVDNGYEAVLVLLDFSAAFDLIDHDILLNRLEKRFGLCGTPLSWITSYLSHRKQFITVGNNTSNEESINRVVPQGSVLGPLLFSLYTSEIEDLFTAHSMDAMIYADDTQFYIALKDTNRSESLQRLQHCIDDIRSWSTLNKLLLNDGKTEIIHIISSFARQAPTLPLAICCGSSTIISKPEAQSLGLTIDNNLLLKSHVNNICRSAFCALTNIGKIRRFLDQKTSASLVYALVISR